MKRNFTLIPGSFRAWALATAVALGAVCGTTASAQNDFQTEHAPIVNVSKANPASVSTDNWISVEDMMRPKSQRLNVIPPVQTEPATSNKGFTQNQASRIASGVSSTPSGMQSNSTSLIPNAINTSQTARRASYNLQDSGAISEPEIFGVPEVPARPLNGLQIPHVVPTPLGYGLGPYGSPEKKRNPKANVPGYNGWNPEAGKDEYVFDGSDRGERVQVDASWNVSGLQTEDTVGHFDTLDGRRIVTPSNRVAIYAPRFAAVRKVDGVFKANINLPVRSYEKKLPVALADGMDESSTTKQHLAVVRDTGSSRASAFIDETRGVVSDNVTHLFGIRNTYETFENLSLIRYGRFSGGETARLSLGLQSALVWEDDLGLQVTVNKATPVITKDVKSVQELLSVKSEDGTAILRVTKIASKIAARAGDYVEFTIRFDNLSGKKIGNVTIIDNLTKRLEYVPDSSECSVKADFINKRNEADSLMLRWEITDPLEPHDGGIIRFKCRVR